MTISFSSHISCRVLFSLLLLFFSAFFLLFWEAHQQNDGHRCYAGRIPSNWPPSYIHVIWSKPGNIGSLAVYNHHGIKWSVGVKKSLYNRWHELYCIPSFCAVPFLRALMWWWRHRHQPPVDALPALCRRDESLVINDDTQQQHGILGPPPGKALALILGRPEWRNLIMIKLDVVFS